METGDRSIPLPSCRRLPHLHNNIHKKLLQVCISKQFAGEIGISLRRVNGNINTFANEQRALSFYFYQCEILHVIESKFTLLMCTWVAIILNGIYHRNVLMQHDTYQRTNHVLHTAPSLELHFCAAICNTLLGKLCPEKVRGDHLPEVEKMTRRF